MTLVLDPRRFGIDAIFSWPCLEAVIIHYFVIRTEIMINFDQKQKTDCCKTGSTVYNILYSNKWNSMRTMSSNVFAGKNPVLDFFHIYQIRKHYQLIQNILNKNPRCSYITT